MWLFLIVNASEVTAMRMNLFDKFLLALALLALLAASLFIGCIAANIVTLQSISVFLASLSDMWGAGGNGWVFSGLALVLFLIVIRLFVASYGSRGPAYTRLAITEHGEVAISIHTIKQITAAFVANKPEIAASSSEILPARDGLFIRVRICVKEGSALPEVTSAIQKELKAHLESTTGLIVKQITVLVDNNRSNYSGKVR